MTTFLPILFFAAAGFCFGGAYAFYTGRKPLWSTLLLVLLGLLFALAGWLYL